MNHNVTLVGVPLDLGAENLGVGMGADTLRYQGITTKLSSAGLTVEDKGKLSVKDRHLVPVGNPKVRQLDEIVRVSEETARISAQALARGDKVVVLGGDHSVCLGAVSGAATQRKLGLIYFDAHGDMNTEETTLTGNIHG